MCILVYREGVHVYLSVTTQNEICGLSSGCPVHYIAKSLKEVVEDPISRSLLYIL